MTPQAVAEDARLLKALKKKFKSYTNIGVRVGYPRHTASAAVCNWVRRGIPYKYKVLYPELFMPHIVPSGQAEQSAQK